MKIALFSDVHGRLRIVLHLIRNWQIAHHTYLDAAMIAGDLGCFPDSSKFDRATKRWTERVPEEAGFSKYFTTPVAEVEQMLAGEFGVRCPILFVPGNHEDYEYLSVAGRCAPATGAPQNTFPVDCYQRFHVIRDGAIVVVTGKDNTQLRVAGIWGIQNTRTNAPYRINAAATQNLQRLGPNSFDVLLTHDAPAEAHPIGGSSLITEIIKVCSPQVHLFGHVHPINGVHEFRVPNCRTKSFIFKNVTFGPHGRDGLTGAMGLMDWDGATAKVEIVREPWLEQMHHETWHRAVKEHIVDPDQIEPNC